MKRPFVTQKQLEEIVRQITEKVRTLDPNYYAVLQLDRAYVTAE